MFNLHVVPNLFSINMSVQEGWLVNRYENQGARYKPWTLSQVEEILHENYPDVLSC